MANFKQKLENQSWLAGRIVSIIESGMSDKGMTQADVNTVLSGILPDYSTPSKVEAEG